MTGPAGAASVVVGTAGHIDHGKTALLRALTGIDADRLPEERRRGITIDIGYAHLTLPDGSTVDFVDVPGHERLVGNMLVGAGEIDAAMLVVAADDGPMAQTIEHLELLDALGVSRALAVITKSDLVPDPARRATVAREVDALLSRTGLAGCPVLTVSALTGEGLTELRQAIGDLARAARGDLATAPAGTGPRLAVDRVFAVRGRGVVVTGSLRGGSVEPGLALRLVPGDAAVRVREVQVRGTSVQAAEGGRTALLLGGVDAATLRRGQVVTADPAVVGSSRILVAVRRGPSLRTAGSGAPGPVARGPVPADRELVRLHLGTTQAEALVVRGPRESIELPGGTLLAVLRLDLPVAVAPGDRFALRRPSLASVAGGGVVLDPQPPRGVSRRRLTPERAAALAATPTSTAARLDLHGVLRGPGGWALAPDVGAALAEQAHQLVIAHHAADPASVGLPLPVMRQELASHARRLVTLDRATAAEIARQVVDGLVARGTLARHSDRLRDPDRPGGLTPGMRAAMDRLVTSLSVAAPPALSQAARDAGCPTEGVRALAAEGRIVRLEDDLAWAADTYRELTRRALAMAATTPLTPAAFRDATGTSRRYVLAVLEDLDRRGLLRRTEAGHVPGPAVVAGARTGAAPGAPG